MRNMESKKVSKIPNKRKLEDTIGGQSNMISVAYLSCAMHYYMKEQASANATIIDDDITMGAISVYEM